MVFGRVLCYHVNTNIQTQKKMGNKKKRVKLKSLAKIIIVIQLGTYYLGKLYPRGL